MAADGRELAQLVQKRKVLCPFEPNPSTLQAEVDSTRHVCSTLRWELQAGLEVEGLCLLGQPPKSRTASKVKPAHTGTARARREMPRASWNWPPCQNPAVTSGPCKAQVLCAMGRLWGWGGYVPFLQPRVRGCAVILMKLPSAFYRLPSILSPIFG